ERRAQGGGRRLQSVPRRRRPDRRRARRAGARAGAAGAGGGRPGHDRRARARRARHPAAPGDAGGRAERARGGRGADVRARTGARGLLPDRAPLGMGGLLRGGRGIRTAGSLLEVLNAVALVDHHAHGILRRPPATLDEFRGLFSGSPDARQWPHVATAVTYMRAMRELADLFGCKPTEDTVHAYRLATDPAEYASRLLRATSTDWLLVDVGFPEDGTTWDELGELAGCAARPILRVESLEREHVRDLVANARSSGFAALKTIAAYRGGLARVQDVVVAALEANEETGDPLPVQVHTGFGDSDLFLPHADPGYLKPLIERFRQTPFV